MALRSSMRALIREPLLYFIVFGSVLFLAYAHLNPGRNASSDPETIVVGRNEIVRFMQNRARVLDGQRFDELVDKLSKTDLERTIREFVREEALYREAKSLQLDRYDYLARRHLVQQLEFVVRDAADTLVSVSDEEEAEYYEAHRTDFRVAPRITFTHIFFSTRSRGSSVARQLAIATLAQLNSEQVRFEQSSAYGDPFIYSMNYVEHEPAEVASYFGHTMTEQLFALEPSARHWRGPFESPYGFHLVLLVRNAPARVPAMGEVKSEVRRRVLHTKLENHLEQVLQSIVRGYAVKLQSDEFKALRAG